MACPGNESFRRIDEVPDAEPTEADVILEELNAALQAPEPTDNGRTPAVHFLRRRIQAVRLESARLHRELWESETREAELRELATTLQTALDHARAENARLGYEAAHLRQIMLELQASSSWRLLHACRNLLRRAMPFLGRSHSP